MAVSRVTTPFFCRVVPNSSHRNPTEIHRAFTRASCTIDDRGDRMAR